MRRRLTLTALCTAGLAIAALGASTGSAAYSEFQTPSRNIRCAYQSDGGPRLACFVISSRKQAWLYPSGGEVAPLSGVDLRNARGLGGRIIRYGRSWSGGPFICTSKWSGMDCWDRYTAEAVFLSHQTTYAYQI